MARDDVDAAPEAAGLEDDDAVDLSFAGPQPLSAAPWPYRLLDVVSAYLPLLMMALARLGHVVAGAQCARRSTRPRPRRRRATRPTT